jgi:adenylate cyclase
MGIEIERKFLLKDNSWQKEAVRGVKYYQGYLSGNGISGTRVRIAGNKGILTIKSAIKGISRTEFEYEIPLDDAKFMLHHFASKPLISKTRHKIVHAGFTWEIDVFDGENEGLILAEIELKDEKQQFEKPAWVGREVTGDMKYYNSRLVGYPYSRWTEEEKN